MVAIPRFLFSSYAPALTWILLALIASIALLQGNVSVTTAGNSGALALIVSIWYLCIDGPHIAASLWRLSSWKQRADKKKTLLLSSTSIVLSMAALWIIYEPMQAKGQALQKFMQFFFILSYWHIANQHFGFFKILDRLKNITRTTPTSLLQLFWLTLWGPLFVRLFIFRPDSGLPLPNFLLLPHLPVVVTIGFYFLAALYLMTCAQAVYLWRQHEISFTHVVYVAGIMPINSLVLFSPFPELFAVMLITFSHNFQYLDFVYGLRFHASLAATSSLRYFLRYLIAGVIFTICFLRGDFFLWWTTILATNVTSLTGEPSFSSQFFASLGFMASIFHYCLDTFMWKVSRDPSLATYIKARAQTNDLS